MAWPGGQSNQVLALPGLTTDDNSTSLPVDHPAYLEGAWKLRLTDENGCISESEEVEVSIKERPQAFASNNGPVCLGKDVQLSSNPLPGAVYRWRKAGETAVFSMQAAPLITNVTEQEEYSLEVEIDGCVSENTSLTSVALHPKPASFPVFDYQMAADCSPMDVNLLANASGSGLQYEWSGVNGFSSQLENPTIFAATSAQNGSYQLKVTNIHGCTAVSPFEISGVVDPLPPPLIQSTGSVCPGEEIVLATQTYGSGQVSYQWYKNNSPVSGATSHLLNLDAVQSVDEGMYRVEVQVNDCELASADLLVEVLSSPEAEPDFNLTFPCEGSSLQFFANTNGIVAWEWSGPNGFSSNSANPLIYNTELMISEPIH